MSRILKAVLAAMLVLTAAMGLKTAVQAHGTMVADGGAPPPIPD